MAGVIGAVIIVVVLLVLPVVIIMTGALGAGIIGWFVKNDVDDEFEGTEFLELGK